MHLMDVTEEKERKYKGLPVPPCRNLVTKLSVEDLDGDAWQV